MKFSQERKVRSFAKKTFGSTRVGREISFLGWVGRRGADDMVGCGWCGGCGGGGGVELVEWVCVCGRCELRFNGCGYWWGVRSWGWGCCSYLWFGILRQLWQYGQGH